MQDILISNLVLSSLITLALGGVVSVMAIVEFIKVILRDARESKENQVNDGSIVITKLFFETKNGLRLLTFIAAALYVFTVWAFGGLNDVNQPYNSLSEWLRYLTFWIILAVVTMGAYDLLRGGKSDVGIQLISSDYLIGDLDERERAMNELPEKPKN